MLQGMGLLLQCASRCLDFCLWLAGNLAFCPGPRSSLSSHRSLLAASALVAFKRLTHARKMQQMLGERKQVSHSWKRVQGRERRRKPLKGRHTETFPLICDVPEGPSREMPCPWGG